MMASTKYGHIRVGIGGWTFAPWRKNFYPDGLVQRRELEYASLQLSTIEINGTWYGAQKPATYAKWRSETPDGFVFLLKAPRYTTDRKTLADAGKTIDEFVFGGLAELGDRLEPILWQFRPHKRFEHDDVAAFADLLPHELDGPRDRYRRGSGSCDPDARFPRHAGPAPRPHRPDRSRKGSAHRRRRRARDRGYARSWPDLDRHRA